MYRERVQIYSIESPPHLLSRRHCHWWGGIFFYSVEFEEELKIA